MLLSSTETLDASEMTRFVAFGGGHGLAATLRALSLLDPQVDITAVVGVADDGGSSGRLRDQYAIVPPGDLRMALAALCEADSRSQLLADLLQFRFNGETDLGGHAVGNLLLTALWETGHSPAQGTLLLGSLLGIRGRVLPCSNHPIDILADIRGHDAALPDDITLVSGQVQIATTAGRVLDVRVSPADPNVGEEVVAAIVEADFLVFGPGSWFTSVLPHLLIPEIRAAIRRSATRKILVVNLSAQPGETTGFQAHDYLNSWQRMCPEIELDFTVFDPGYIENTALFSQQIHLLGAQEIKLPLQKSPSTHDPHLLAKAFIEVLKESRSNTWR